MDLLKFHKWKKFKVLSMFEILFSPINISFHFTQRTIIFVQSLIMTENPTFFNHFVIQNNSFENYPNKEETEQFAMELYYSNKLHIKYLLTH